MKSGKRQADGEKQRGLSEEKYLCIKEDVRQGWRALGLLHLRMQNDMDTGEARRIGRGEIADKMEEVAEKLRNAIGRCRDDGD